MAKLPDVHTTLNASPFSNQASQEKTTNCLLSVLGSRDGAVVRALTSHQCRPVSIPGLGVMSGLSLLLVLVPAPRVFLRVLRFSSLHKNQHFQIPIRPGNSREKSHSVDSTEIPIYFCFIFHLCDLAVMRSGRERYFISLITNQDYIHNLNEQAWLKV